MSSENPDISPNISIDVLAVGAHPDDADLGCSGTLLKMASLGYKTGILDMSRGEMGTRGTPEIRDQEAQDAAKVLGLSVRESLGLPDAHITCDENSRVAMIRFIRKYRPRVILTHHWDEPHPDHVATARIVQEASFLSGLYKYDQDAVLPRYRPSAVAYFVITRRSPPSFIVDISEFAAEKVRAIKCHKSQFFNPDSKEPSSRVSAETFLRDVESRQRFWGALIGSEHGEAFVVREALNVNDPVALLTRPMNLYS
ncbi:MAG TPA: bacillithiol biosynthesis deacetylase BshB1 [Blastocatellia bacterium]|nr:bacillithiol biosynthesis deacetylase BshB1 [Blastocatellia bacterium]